MHSNHTVVAQSLGRFHGGGQFGGMMGVVIHNDGAVALALDFKTAAGAVELLCRTDSIFPV